MAFLKGKPLETLKVQWEIGQNSIPKPYDSVLGYFPKRLDLLKLLTAVYKILNLLRRKTFAE